ncbi:MULTISPECIES: hypothetical protein [Roseateles]|uniref:Uncharacterized protein n=1 Tax=Roseateles albus TaxID=2987525 RepID=A0ABT5KF39_9BURK|nr:MULTISPECIES: hypothetical protein [Roseateles]MCV2358241.1 hypothetical protein [Paucibacter sp. TC2R-5]MDC8772543.1 hypothetical protein [Roseateles albus]
MSKAAISIRVFGFYLLGLGAVLTAFPNLLLRLFFIPPTEEVWIRVVGVLVFNIGVYYLFAAQAEAESAFRASVLTRALVFLAFLDFALLGLAPPMLVAFGAVDLAGAIWTWMALKRRAGR